MIQEIDIERLRKDLLDYYGTALFVVSPLAIIELNKIERANDEELINLAISNNFNLNKYISHSKTKRKK